MGEFIYHIKPSDTLETLVGTPPMEILTIDHPLDTVLTYSIKVPLVYQVISDVGEIRWFFDHVIQKPQINEAYSAVFVSRHKKLTEEEAKEYGITRREAEFLSTQTFRLKNIKNANDVDDEDVWTFDHFLKTLKRFNVDKGAYTTPSGKPIPEKTIAVIFYVNPCDDMKVCHKFVEKYLDVNEAITKAMLQGKTAQDNLQSYRFFGSIESNIKHLRANQKSSRYWMDFDIDVPKWFKESNHIDHDHRDTYYNVLLIKLKTWFGKGNYVVVDTSGGYHVLVKTSAIHSNPENFCLDIASIYKRAVDCGEAPYVDENGNCKFECIINNSQIPGLPLPGTFQYGRPVTVLNKEDFE